MESGRFVRHIRSSITRRPLLAVPPLLLCLGAPARAGDSGNFIVSVGRDTTSVEHYVREPRRLEVDQIGRSPRVLRRHFVYEFVEGGTSRFSMVVTPPGSTTPTQTVEASFDPDSLRVRTQNGSDPVKKTALAVPSGTIVLPSSSPWVGYEAAIMKLVSGKQDSSRTPIWFLGSSESGSMTVRRMGRDSVSLENERGLYHVRIDKAGHILDVKPITGTAQYAAHRVANLDLDAMAANYAAREKAGAGLGVLSPRDTVRADDVGGASLMIDYSRPAKRGRVVFGGVVPYGQVWRTGANAATQFKTDKPLDFGGTVVPPGFYTLWTVPTASGWKLLVNGETGQWGTEHKAEKDLYTIEMKVTRLPQAVERFTIAVDRTPQGGILNLDWDTTRASAGFTVQR